MKLLTTLVFLLLTATASALPESYYQDIFAAQIGGRTEVTAGDGTRCDILTDSYAIEVDFARKWGEAIGQSLNYGFQFNRQAGIVLILEKPSDRKHLIRVNSIISITTCRLRSGKCEHTSKAAHLPQIMPQT